MEEKIKSKVSIKELDNHNDKIHLKTLKDIYEKLVSEQPIRIGNIRDIE